MMLCILHSVMTNALLYDASLNKMSHKSKIPSISLGYLSCLLPGHIWGPSPQLNLLTQF